MSLTPGEFLRLQDSNRLTDLQLDDNWNKHIADESVTWQGRIKNIVKTDDEITVSIYVSISSDKAIQLQIKLSMEKKEELLTFSRDTEIEVSGKFANHRSDDTPFVLSYGRIARLP